MVLLFTLKTYLYRSFKTFYNTHYMKIISIVKLDGSGKSTQIQLYQTCSENTGKKVFYFHAVNFSIAAILNKNTKRSAQNKTTDITRASWSAIQLQKYPIH